MNEPMPIAFETAETTYEDMSACNALGQMNATN